MSYFSELGALDRPYVDISINLGGTDVAVRARALSAKDADALEALQNDEYGRLLTWFTEGTPGEIPEVERVAGIYGTKSQREIVEQLLPTRDADITARGLEASGIDLKREIAYMKTMETDDEREAYAKLQNEKLEEAKDVAKDEVREELMAQPIEAVARMMAQVNVNLRAMQQSTRLYHNAFVYYSLYKPEENVRCFVSIDEVANEFTEAKIAEAVGLIRTGLQSTVPFVSPDDAEPVTPPSSPSTSAVATKVGGKRIKATKGDSKSSTLPA